MWNNSAHKVHKKYWGYGSLHDLILEREKRFGGARSGSGLRFNEYQAKLIRGMVHNRSCARRLLCRYQIEPGEEALQERTGRDE